MLYPKIETLYNRDEATHCIPKYVPERSLRRIEFALPNRWLLTEKIDGTNVRVIFEQHAAFEVHVISQEEPIGMNPKPTVRFAGRTDAAQLPPFLLARLQALFPVEKFATFEDDRNPHTLPKSVVLFGEGYGARIQKGGGNYRPDASFRLFDVVITGMDDRPWWLDWNNVEDIAQKLGIETVPVLSRTARLSDAIEIVEDGQLYSRVAHSENDGMVTLAEGIVARTDPLLFDRRGQRLVWKLKVRDFLKETHP